MLKIEELSEALKNRDLRMALCHTDVHGWNLMSTGQLKLIDWEGLKLAPVEADMMSFVDEPYFSEFMRIYANTHSHYEVNIEALTFYQGDASWRMSGNSWSNCSTTNRMTKNEHQRSTV